MIWKVALTVLVVIAVSVVAVAVLTDALIGEPDYSPPETTSPPASTPPSIPEESAEAEVSPSPSVIKNWEISNLRYTVIEKNDSWWKFSWQLSLKNNTSSIVDFFIYVNFLNRNGYIVDDDIENPSHFAPKEQRVIKGYALIDAELAPDVTDAEAEISRAYIVD